ncbi:putative membrane protein [Nocardioides zeae]|uniref:Membrane protein n=2 Tax=Nocardioides zeae TaxID=1457234 RepID=A0ACC6IHC0_9ACTN|nr:hypothetical protein [Nocardioides zeae]MDQ1103102.1 putative membrane protein [Nocardioides zeae]MDR6173178.1 putative membrane protein [Nocardioides zeae]MDR6210171.1 putative membrane protein [Nocardioides zeae]
MLVVWLSLFLVLVVAGAVVAVVASTSAEAQESENRWVQRLRGSVPSLPVIREDEDVHLRR